LRTAHLKLTPLITTKTLNWLWASMVTGGPPLASIEIKQLEQLSLGRGPCVRKMVPPVACKANVMEVKAPDFYFPKRR
jgi:hypothetical protein